MHLDSSTTSLLALNEQSLKSLKAITASISYCRHTHIKIVMGTEFHNCKLKHKLFKSEHWVFQCSAYEIIELLSASKTPTEKYLCTVALLVTSGLVDTSRCALHLDTKEFRVIEKEMMQVLKPLLTYMNTKPDLQIELPTFMVAVDNCENPCFLKEFLKTVRKRLQLFYGGGLESMQTKAERQAGMLEDEIEHERKLVAILSDYSPRASRYNARTGKWAIKQMQIKNPDITEEQVEVIKHYLNNPTLESLDTTVLKEVTKLCKESLPYDEGMREQSLLIIKHLESKLRTINDINASLGFIVLENELVHNEAANISYTTKSKVSNDVIYNTTKIVKITNSNPQGLTALDRAKAKFARSNTSD